jgi:hypothetical protein
MRKQTVAVKLVTHEENDNPADFSKDVAEITAEHGTDALVVIEQLAARLEARREPALTRTALKAELAELPHGKGGRRTGKQVDGARLRELRGDIKQEALAELSGRSVDSIQRGEADGRWSKDMFDDVAGALSVLLQRTIEPEDLEKLSRNNRKN